MPYLILYFFAGLLQDFLVTLNMRFITHKKTLLAVVSSFFATMVGFLVLYDIFIKLDDQRSFLAILIYSLGVAVGTLFGMKFKPWFKD